MPDRRSHPADLTAENRTEQLPALATKFGHLHLRDWSELCRAGVDRDSRQQHPKLQILEIGGLRHYVFTPKVVPALLQDLYERLCVQITIDRFPARLVP